MSLHASPLATRYRTQAPSLRTGLADLLHTLSLRLDAFASALQTPSIETITAEPVLEFSRDPDTGHGVLYENGQRRFTFLQGLDRL